MAPQRRSRPGVWLAAVASALVLAGTAFTGASGPLRAPAAREAGAVAREAKGFGITKTNRKRVRVDSEAVLADHGATVGPEIVKVLSGEKLAETPGEMMRARFSALRSQDALFMARTERDENRKSLEKRARGWAVTFGQEERKDEDGPPGLQMALEKLEKLEILAEEDDEVEFKLYCGEVGVLHERSVFQEDERFGWIFSGENIFQNSFEPEG